MKFRFANVSPALLMRAGEEKESPSPGPGLEDLECHFCSEKATHKEMMLVGIVLHAYNPNI